MRRKDKKKRRRGKINYQRIRIGHYSNQNIREKSQRKRAERIQRQTIGTSWGIQGNRVNWDLRQDFLNLH